MKRVFFDILLLLSVFLLPWWVTTVLVLAGVFIFREFYELLVVGVMMYSIYRIPGPAVISSPIWFPIILIAIYLGTQALRRYMILYKNEI